MASIENEHVKFGEIVDNCNMSLALQGHSNKQICMIRRDLFKPEIKEEYSHLCSHSLPYSSWLFVDDISKKTKEIEDSNRLGYKKHRVGRCGGPRGWFGYGSRVGSLVEEEELLQERSLTTSLHIIILPTLVMPLKSSEEGGGGGNSKTTKA